MKKNIKLIKNNFLLLKNQFLIVGAGLKIEISKISSKTAGNFFCFFNTKITVNFGLLKSKKRQIKEKDYLKKIMRNFVKFLNFFYFNCL